MGPQFYPLLLEEIGEKVGLTLQPNEHNTCVIPLPEGMDVQIEMHEDEETVLLTCELGVVPVGKYRENLFKEALRANGMPQPVIGRFGFSENDDTLNLFEILPAKELTADKVMEILPKISEKAKVWSEAIENGEIPVVEAVTTSASSSQPGGLFGL